VSTRLGKFGQVVAAVAPGLHQLVMTAAYAALPESAPKKEGREGGPAGHEHAHDREREHKEEQREITPEAYALTMLMRGIHL